MTTVAQMQSRRNPTSIHNNDDTVDVRDNVPDEPSSPFTSPFTQSVNDWGCTRDWFSVNDMDPYIWCGGSSTAAAKSPNAYSVPASGDDTECNSIAADADPATTSQPFAIKLDEHMSTGRLDDGESLDSGTTMGTNVFGSLKSLPSVADSRIPINTDVNDNFSVESTGEVSALTLPIRLQAKSEESDIDDDDTDAEPIVWDTSSIGSGNTLTSATLESAVDEKLKQVVEDDADETIGDTVKSAKDLIRSTSSVSNRSLRIQKKVARTERRDKLRNHTKNLAAGSVTSDQSNQSQSKVASLVRSLRAAIDKHGRYDVRCAEITASLGDAFEEDKEFGQALKLYREVTNIYSVKLGDHHFSTIDAKIRAAKLLEKMGDFDRSIELYWNVLSMRKAICDEKDSSVPDTLSFIAQALKRKGRAPQAIKELKRALKLYRASLGDAHPRVTSTVDEISALYIVVGDFDKATAILEEVVKLKAATLGVNNDEVAKSLVDLATAYESGGDHPKALRSLKKAYSINASIHGEGSDETTFVLERIALNYKASNDIERCVAAFLGVLRGRKDIFGESHPIVADTYLQLGVALREQNQLEKAMKCMKQSLSIYVGEGRDMNDVGMIAEVMHEMGVIHRCKGQMVDALKIFKQELTIRQKMGPRELHQVAVTLHNLGTTELEMRNNTKALNYLMEALQIYEKTNEEVGVDFAETLYCTGIVFDATRHHDRAREAYEEAIKLFVSEGLNEEQIQARLAKLNKLKTLNVEPGQQQGNPRPRKILGQKVKL